LKILDFPVGTVVFLGIIGVATPPKVSIESVSGSHPKAKCLLRRLENAGLHRGAERHDFIRINPFVRFFAEQLLDRFLDRGHLVCPPTKITSFTSASVNPAPFGAAEVTVSFVSAIE